MSDSRKILSKITIIALFTALAFVGVFIQIKMPTGDMVHLGNFVMILAALLLGGLEGGLVGSLGMGLYDLIYYTSKPSTIIRTFVLKFLIGFLVGYLFRLILKKKLNTKYLLIGATSFFLLVFGVSLGLFLNGDFADFSFSNGLSSNFANFLGSGKTVKISLYIPIFSLIFAIGTVLSIVFERKLSTRSKAALFAILSAVLLNIIGEFILRWLLEGTFNVLVSDLNDGFTVSLATATSKIPGSLITGFLSVFLAVLIYEPIYRGVKNLTVFKDDTVDLIEGENEAVESEIKEENTESNEGNLQNVSHN
ncbi:MAG: ECF transporter S component [Acholeplasmatales bacterium]|nr:ECF transporter S component [Acholeplasmatales bacterium]